MKEKNQLKNICQEDIIIAIKILNNMIIYLYKTFTQAHTMTHNGGVDNQVKFNPQNRGYRNGSPNSHFQQTSSCIGWQFSPFFY